MGLCNCLAVYDWIGEIEVSEFHAIARHMFCENGVEADTATCSDAEKPQPYSAVMDRINGATTNEVVELFHTTPGHKQLAFGWDAMAALNTSEGKTMVFCFDESLRGLQLSYLESVVERLTDIVQITYGIGYQRALAMGPDLYSYGMAAGLGYTQRDMAEADRIGAWMRERLGPNRHLEGQLRDVYPMNVISNKHLARCVGEGSLQEWISESHERGCLRNAGDDTWIWNVDAERIDSVRAGLAQIGDILVP